MEDAFVVNILPSTPPPLPLFFPFEWDLADRYFRFTQAEYHTRAAGRRVQKELEEQRR
jgi:hypothetical protein